MDAGLFEKDKQLLQLLQTGLPVVSRPFRLLGEGIFMDEANVLGVLRDWKEKGTIRWLGAIFSTHALGYHTTLAAMSLPDEKLIEAASVVNQHPGVTHNYQREHEYNLWFTLAVPSEKNIDTEMERLAEAAGAKKRITLPVVKTFKINLVLPVASEEANIMADEVSPPSDKVYSLTEEEKALVRILQEDWPLVVNPYSVLASQWGKTETQLLEKLETWIKLGIIRRIGAILRHREIGFTINWMAAWQLREELIDTAGRQAARCALVSHCYWRQPTTDWPYQLFTMIHSRSHLEAEQTVNQLHQLIQPMAYKILPTVREFKKVRLRLFV